MACIREELPYDYNFRHMAGIHLVKDGGLFDNDTYDIEPEKVDIESWTETYETVHDCISNGDCKRCANNDRVMYEYLEIRSKFDKRKVFTFVRSIQDQLGACWTNWKLMTSK